MPLGIMYCQRNAKKCQSKKTKQKKCMERIKTEFFNDNAIIILHGLWHKKDPGGNAKNGIPISEGSGGEGKFIFQLPFLLLLFKNAIVGLCQMNRNKCHIKCHHHLSSWRLELNLSTNTKGPFTFNCLERMKILGTFCKDFLTFPTYSASQIWAAHFYHLLRRSANFGPP
jgi:hypothetical protein